MKTLSLLLLTIVLATNDLASSYKVDYTNGHNKIHFENNRYMNGKPVNEPKIEEAIQTLSKLGFKPDNAKILTEDEQTEQTRLIKTIQRGDQNGAMSQQQQQLQQQHQQFMQHQQQLQMQKRMPNMGQRSGVVNLAMRQQGRVNPEQATLDNQNHKLTELQELAGAKQNNAGNFQPTIDSITHQNANNKAVEKLMAMRTYLPYFKAKYGLGDDFSDPLTEGIEEQNELTTVPLLYNAARKQAADKKDGSGEGVRSLSFAYNGQMNGMPYNGPNNYQNQQYQQQGQQQNYNMPSAPQLQQQNYNMPSAPQLPQLPQYQAQIKQAYSAPAQESYSAKSAAGDSETSDIFITNINENYNNLNNTQTENTIAKSNNADRNYNRNDDKATFKTASYL